MRRLLLPILMSIPLAACAASGNGDYPSLAQRPIETRFAVTESVPLPLPGPLPADLAGRVQAWRDRVAAAEAGFAAALPTAQTAVAAAARAPVASEAWISAQQQLSRLAILRGPVADALADVDALYIARQGSDAVDGLPALLALRDALAVMLEQQNAQLSALAARLAD
jgi:hypothetical protein